MLALRQRVAFEEQARAPMGTGCLTGSSERLASARAQAERQRGGSPDPEDKYAYTDAFDADDVAFLRELP